MSLPREVTQRAGDGNGPSRISVRSRPTAEAAPPSHQGGHTFSHNTVSDNARAIFGNIHEGDNYNIQNATFVRGDPGNRRVAFAKWLDCRGQDTTHNRHLRNREPGTGLWFLESTVLETWKTQPSSLIWLHGEAGCGKTVLCASIIDKMRGACDDANGDRLCYFYFSFQDDFRQDLAAMLRLVLAQLCTPTSIPQPLQALYDRCHDVWPPRAPSTDDLQETLLSILREADDLQASLGGNGANERYGNIYLILDALDEIPIKELDAVLELLQDLAQLGSPVVHVLVTSRVDSTIEACLTQPVRWSSVAISPETVNKDIKLYITSVIEKYPRLKRQKQITKDLIYDRLANQAAGM
jgi:hypothetical protein